MIERESGCKRKEFDRQILCLKLRKIELRIEVLSCRKCFGKSILKMIKIEALESVCWRAKDEIR